MLRQECSDGLFPPLRLFHALFVMLAQLSGCAGIICSPAVEEVHAPRRLPIFIRDVEDIALLPNDELIVVSRRVPTATDVTLIGRLGVQGVAEFPELVSAEPGPAILNAGSWWLSRMGEHDAGASLFFVSAGEQILQKEVKLVGTPLLWMPVRGPEPRGLLVFVDIEQPALIIQEGTPAGLKPLASFPWWQDGTHLTIWPSRLWSAESLDASRYVIAAIDGPRGDRSLRMRTVGGGAPTELALPCKFADQPIATAVDGSGRLAIVGLSEEKEVLALIADVDRPGPAECRAISPANEVIAGHPSATPTVVWTGNRFIAAWIRNDGRIRACDLRELRAPPLIADIGEDADSGRPLRQLVQTNANAETVTFLWRDRSGNFIAREVPADLRAYALLPELRRLFCAALKAMSRHAPMRL